MFFEHSETIREELKPYEWQRRVDGRSCRLRQVSIPPPPPTPHTPERTREYGMPEQG